MAQQLLRHESPATTAGYLHPTRVDLDAAPKSLDALNVVSREAVRWPHAAMRAQYTQCTISDVMSSRQNGTHAAPLRRVPTCRRTVPHRPGARAKILLFANCGESLHADPCRRTAARLACRLHRARSAGRSKPLLGAVRGSGKPTGTADESATGSVNFLLTPRELGEPH
jgi:hypothetical protein